MTNKKKFFASTKNPQKRKPKTKVQKETQEKKAKNVGLYQR